LQGEVLEAQLAYWKQQLSGNLPVLQFPADGFASASSLRPRGHNTFQGATYSFTLPANLSSDLKTLSRKEGVTLFMTMLAAFQTLLYRYTGQEDILVGTDVANRNRRETESLIGFFVNILILRTFLGGNPSFRELLGRVLQVTLGAYAHQDLPFGKLVEILRPERSPVHTPLFQVLFVMQNSPIPPLELPGLSLSFARRREQNSKVRFALFLTEKDDGIQGNWNYSTDLFEATTIARMTGHFQTLLNNIVAQPDARLSNLEILAESEKKQQEMEKQERKDAKLKKFMKVAPKPVSFLQESLVKTEYLCSGETLPLVIKPAVADIDIIDWAKNNREFIESKLLHHGALLFRDFNLNSVTAFENFAGAICPELFGEYGDLPREEVGGKVYGSTPYPSEKAILFHNESSHLHCWPLKIWFFCVQPAQGGGETPIVDCRKIYKMLDPKLRSHFEKKQLMYVRNYTEGLDVSWQEFFHTEDKKVVEKACKKAKTVFEWKEGNGLRTRRIAQAITKHPKTGDAVFFNQILLHHISCLDPAVRKSLLSLFGEDNLPRNVYYGDGSPIEDSVMEEIQAIYREATVSFPWQQGDVLMLDNMLVSHSRNPYVGSRKIVVAMGEMFSYF
jgi:alpha-ketoglutarate-dependent taurine dioxygenase